MEFKTEHMTLQDIDLTNYIACDSGFDEILRSLEVYDALDDTNKQHLSLITPGALNAICRYYRLEERHADRLQKGLMEIQNSSELRAIYTFLVWDLCRDKAGKEGDFYLSFRFVYKSVCPDCRKFLLLLSCLDPSEKLLQKRGVPKEYHTDTPGFRIGPQMEQYRTTDNCEVLDFPWDKNFYTRQIFLLDRFYFIPFSFGDPFRLYRRQGDGTAERNSFTKAVVGIYEKGYPVSRDGQLIAETEDQILKVQKKETTNVSFYTDFAESEKEVYGTYMNPCGILSTSQRRLDKSNWREALKSGDVLLALHVPGGEGYNVNRLQHSMELALDFFDRYYPELSIKGFWSESWLYDNRLALLLDPSTNIVQVQRRYYNYSIGSDDEMLYREVWHTKKGNPGELVARTSLQKKVLSALEKGNHFCTTSMIVLREDVDLVERQMLYITDEDWQEFCAVMKTGWK